jgi:predicted Abi (CAAX) family protease
MAASAPDQADSNYLRYVQAAFNRPDYYPLDQRVDLDRYRPVARWAGRLILPAWEARRESRGVLLEVHLADEAHRHLIGQVVDVRWSERAVVQARVWAVTRDVVFTPEALKSAAKGGIHPTRLNTWRLVGPLESLAGGHPTDDVIVALAGEVTVQADPTAANGVALVVEDDPVQITGRYYCLAQFAGPADDGGERYHVRHYNRATAQFDGPDETVLLPIVINNGENIAPFTNAGIEQSPLNVAGWYLHGAKNAAGEFVVQAVVPRRLMQVQPERVVLGDAAWPAIRHAWKDAVANKGNISSFLCSATASTPEAALAGWQEGDRALLLHTYSGIGGKKREKAARAFLYAGHFSFGTAQVVREPLADELQFDIVYHQVYTTNVDGLIAGALAWSRYMGDRQLGWAGSRPTCDILLRLPSVTDDYDFDDERRSGLREVVGNLATMTARYRTGDGTGGTYVGIANNCAQDSAQAFYASVKDLNEDVTNRPAAQDWMTRHPEDAARLRELLAMAPELRRMLVGSRAGRADWRFQSANLGISESPLRNLLRGLSTWRTILPGTVSNAIARSFLQHGASVWVLRTNQLGGHDPDIEPVPLTTPF